MLVGQIERVVLDLLGVLLFAQPEIGWIVNFVRDLFDGAKVRHLDLIYSLRCPNFQLNSLSNSLSAGFFHIALTSPLFSSILSFHPPIPQLFSHCAYLSLNLNHGHSLNDNRRRLAHTQHVRHTLISIATKQFYYTCTRLSCSIPPTTGTPVALAADELTSD